MDGYEKKHSLTWFEKWFLKKICNKLVCQGRTHHLRIRSYYRIMYKAARAEFTEDNDVTLNGFLEDCHAAAGGLWCRNCQERDIEKLVWIDNGRMIRCQTCGKVGIPLSPRFLSTLCS